MSTVVAYPADWIGVPPFGAGEDFATPRDWALALTDELVALDGAPAQARDGLVEALSLAGQDVAHLGAAGYLWFETWQGPMWTVVARLADAPARDDRELARHADADDPSHLRPPRVRHLTTGGDLPAVVVEGHTPLYDEHPDIVAVRVTAAVAADHEICVLATSTTDLAAFERFRPHFDALVRSVRALP